MPKPWKIATLQNLQDKCFLCVQYLQKFIVVTVLPDM